MRDFLAGFGVGTVAMAVVSYFYAVKAIADIKKFLGAANTTIKKVI